MKESIKRIIIFIILICPFIVNAKLEDNNFINMKENKIEFDNSRYYKIPVKEYEDSKYLIHYNTELFIIYNKDTGETKRYKDCNLQSIERVKDKWFILYDGILHIYDNTFKETNKLELGGKDDAEAFITEKFVAYVLNDKIITIDITNNKEQINESNENHLVIKNAKINNGVLIIETDNIYGNPKKNFIIYDNGKIYESTSKKIINSFEFYKESFYYTYKDFDTNGIMLGVKYKDGTIKEVKIVEEIEDYRPSLTLKINDGNIYLLYIKENQAAKTVNIYSYDLDLNKISQKRMNNPLTFESDRSLRFFHTIDDKLHIAGNVIMDKNLNIISMEEYKRKKLDKDLVDILKSYENENYHITNYFYNDNKVRFIAEVLNSENDYEEHILEYNYKTKEKTFEKNIEPGYLMRAFKITNYLVKYIEDYTIEVMLGEENIYVNIYKDNQLISAYIDNKHNASSLNEIITTPIGIAILAEKSPNDTYMYELNYTLNIRHPNEVMLSKLNPSMGEEVELNIPPKEGLKPIVTIKDNNGTIIPLNNNKFIMPNSNVTIDLKYEPIKDTINPETKGYIFNIILISLISLLIGIYSFKKIYKY